jgi:hypothetical protein
MLPAQRAVPRRRFPQATLPPKAGTFPGSSPAVRRQLDPDLAAATLSASGCRRKATGALDGWPRGLAAELADIACAARGWRQRAGRGQQGLGVLVGGVAAGPPPQWVPGQRGLWWAAARLPGARVAVAGAAGRAVRAERTSDPRPGDGKSAAAACESVRLLADALGLADWSASSSRSRTPAALGRTALGTWRSGCCATSSLCYTVRSHARGSSLPTAPCLRR